MTPLELLAGIVLCLLGGGWAFMLGRLFERKVTVDRRLRAIRSELDLLESEHKAICHRVVLFATDVDDVINNRTVH